MNTRVKGAEKLRRGRGELIGQAGGGLESRDGGSDDEGESPFRYELYRGIMVGSKAK